MNLRFDLAVGAGRKLIRPLGSLTAQLARLIARPLYAPKLPDDPREPEACEQKSTARQMAYAHYQDDTGQPRFVASSVLFWDLLGISAMSTAATKQALVNLRGVRAAIEAARERASTEEEGFLRCSTWFTDNVVIATPVVGPQDVDMTLGPTFVDAAYMQLYLLREGYLARGAVSFGPHYIDKSFVFGPALIDAHTLETDDGGNRWPCVAVTDDVADLCREMSRRYEANPKAGPYASELVVDEQGGVFVDQLGIWLDEEDDPQVIAYWVPLYRNLIRRRLGELRPTSRVWQKWRWLADYHDFTLRDRQQNRRNYITGLTAWHKFIPFRDTI
jgi:hypothetical protein